MLDSPAWASDGKANQVAAAVLEWAKDNGANTYCHWFQPLGASAFRHGLSAQVHVAMVEFNAAGEPVWDFNGKKLLKGETDGSSFPNGGLRATHTAGAYLGIDPTSPIFLRGDTIFIPATMVSYHGHALDEKTPLLRASDALSREGSRLLKLLGMKGVAGVRADIGLEQEFFLVPRGAYLRRPDLQLTGRTVIGNQPPRRWGGAAARVLLGATRSATSVSVPRVAMLQPRGLRPLHGASIAGVARARVHASCPGGVLQARHPPSHAPPGERGCPRPRWSIHAHAIARASPAVMPLPRKSRRTSTSSLVRPGHMGVPRWILMVCLTHMPLFSGRPPFSSAAMFGSVTTQTDQNVVVMQARRGAGGCPVQAQLLVTFRCLCLPTSPLPLPCGRSSRRWLRSTASRCSSRRSPSRAPTARARYEGGRTWCERLVPPSPRTTPPALPAPPAQQLEHRRYGRRGRQPAEPHAPRQGGRDA